MIIYRGGSILLLKIFNGSALDPFSECLRSENPVAEASNPFNELISIKYGIREEDIIKESFKQARLSLIDLHQIILVELWRIQEVIGRISLIMIDQFDTQVNHGIEVSFYFLRIELDRVNWLVLKETI